MKSIDFATNFENDFKNEVYVYFCSQHGKQEPIFAAHKVFDLPPKPFRICKVCDQIYDHRKLITNLKFAED